MIQIRVTTASKNGWTTGFNGTLSDARAYFLGTQHVSQDFQTGQETRDTITGVAFVGNTAQLRDQAYEAKKALKWELAAELYQAAFDAYPPSQIGQLAEKDREALRSNARSCRAMALANREEVAA